MQTHNFISFFSNRTKDTDNLRVTQFREYTFSPYYTRVYGWIDEIQSVRANKTILEREKQTHIFQMEFKMITLHHGNSSFR